MAKYKPAQAAKVREAIRSWNDVNKTNHAQYYEFFDFILGNQWRDDDAKVFQNYKKIPLTVNKLAPKANQLMGEQRQNTVQLQVEPLDGTDAETCETYEALIKKISLDGHAKQVYQVAYKQSTIGGFGAYVWGTEYETDDTFNQIIRPYALNDPCKAYWSIAAKEISKIDSLRSGYREKLSRKAFINKYGQALNSKIGDTSLDMQDDSNQLNMSLADDKSVTIINDYERRSEMIKIYQLSNGDILEGDEIEQVEAVYKNDKTSDRSGLYYYKGEPVQIKNTREVERFSVFHTQWAGDYELDSTPFPSKHSPVIFVDQDSYYDKNGKQIYRPFFKDAKDTQRYLNYLRTQKAHFVKIMRNDQYIASKKNVASPDTAKIWRDPQVVQGALLYDETPNGNKPERQPPGEISQSLTSEYVEASGDLDFTTGIFDTQMGNQGDVVSGKASDAQTKRGGVNTYITRDGLNRSIESSGIVVNEMIPNVYDSERTVSLQIPNKGKRKITLNKQMDAYGSKVQNDMTKGKFSVRLIAGQSYEGEKSQNLQSIEMVLQNAPELFEKIGDILIKNLPMTDSLELENRIRTMIPPEIIEAGKTGQMPPPKPQPPDPMLVLKQQELQGKMMIAQMNHQAKMVGLQNAYQKMMLDAHVSGADMTVQLQKVHADQEALQAEMADNMRDYQAEMARIHSQSLHQHLDRGLDADKHHSEQVLKILMHEPEHLKPKEPAHDKIAS